MLRPEFVRDNLAALGRARRQDGRRVSGGRRLRGPDRSRAPQRGRVPRRRRGTRPLPQDRAPQLRGLRREALLRARRPKRAGVGRRHLRGPLRLRGRLADRRPVRCLRRRSARHEHQRVAVPPAEAGGAARRASRPGPGVRRLDRVRERRRRPGRDRLRRRVARDGSGRRGRLPGVAVRRGSADRRRRGPIGPRPARLRVARAARVDPPGARRRPSGLRAEERVRRRRARALRRDRFGVRGIARGRRARTGCGARPRDALSLFEPGERRGRVGCRHTSRDPARRHADRRGLRRLPVGPPDRSSRVDART